MRKIGISMAVLVVMLGASLTVAAEDDLDAMARRLRALEFSVARITAQLAYAQEPVEIEGTVALLSGIGSDVHVLQFGADLLGQPRNAVLALPNPRPAGEVPLVMALHGYGSSLSGIGAWAYTRVNLDGYALLIPNGSVDMYGNRFWNANEFCCDFRNFGIDDVSALKALTETVIADHDLGPLYLFGYSNGAHMSYRLVCEGTPDLRAIAAISGTDHIDEKQCPDAVPVSILHVHGTHDHVVLFDGNDGDVGVLTGGPEHYVGAREVVSRWAERSDCTWPEDSYAAMDLDQAVPGAETKAFELSCEDVNIELWTSEGTGHVPAFGQAFTDAVIPWLLSR